MYHTIIVVFPTAAAQQYSIIPAPPAAPPASIIGELARISQVFFGVRVQLATAMS